MRWFCATIPTTRPTPAPHSRTEDHHAQPSATCCENHMPAERQTVNHSLLPSTSKQNSHAATHALYRVLLRKEEGLDHHHTASHLQQPQGHRMNTKHTQKQLGYCTAKPRRQSVPTTGTAHQEDQLHRNMGRRRTTHLAKGQPQHYTRVEQLMSAYFQPFIAGPSPSTSCQRVGGHDGAWKKERTESKGITQRVYKAAASWRRHREPE